MTLLEFSEKWINENVPASEIYGDAIKDKVAELVDCFIKQKHSGASASVTLGMFQKLMDDYNNQNWRMKP